MGHVAKSAEKLIATVKDSYEYLFKEQVQKASAAYNSMWTDTNVYNEIGIPCVKIRPSPTTIDQEKKYGAMPIGDIMNAAKLYTLVGLEVANWPPKSRPQ